ncbi:MAG: S1 RNA-binding domain-containing protein, partial [Candidatus Cloacimonadaceae bacterium]|nr:S1 RNA-binding domain-containing protein [Candidatus Cloacimonadaceae bacterium]
QIIRIDNDTQKISLSLKALQEDPWDGIDEIVKVNESIEGIVESSTNFGMFVSIHEGITGLLPRSRVRRTDNYKSGDKLEMVVTAIDKESRRITLDYADRTAEELEEIKQREDRPRERRDQEPRSFSNDRSSSDRPRKGGGRGRSDEEWRKYANQKQADPDNPFKDL